MSEKLPAKRLEKCPMCDRPVPHGAADCHGCGLVFAKWEARQKKEKRAAADALAALELPKATPVDPNKIRIAAGVFVALWVLGLAFYYQSRLPALRAAAAAHSSAR